jgi:hypothetical protein
MTNSSAVANIETILKTDLKDTQEAFAQYISQMIEDFEDTRRYQDTYLMDVSDPTIGRGGTKMDLSKEFTDAHRLVLENLSKKDSPIIGAYVKAAVDLGLAYIQSNGSTRTDIASLVMADLVALVSDSVIAKALENREQEGGARLTMTLEPMQKYLICSIIGQSMDTGPFKVEAKQDGLTTNGTLVKFLGEYIASKNTSKTPEQIFFAQIALTAFRERMAQMKTVESFEALEKSQIAAIDSLSRRLEKSVDDTARIDWLGALKLVSPRTFVEVAAVLGATEPIQKTERYHSSRMNRARKVSSAMVKALGGFNAAFAAGGKMLVGEIDDMVPVNEAFAVRVQTAIPTQTVAKFISANDKLSGLGDDGEGPFYAALTDIGKKEPKWDTWSRTRLSMFHHLVSKMLAKDGHLRSKTFVSGDEAHQNFAELELYTLGLLLRNTQGESETIKQEARREFIGLLVDIVTDYSQGSEVRFGEGIKDTALRAISHCLPFWPLNSQREFVRAIFHHATTKDSWILDQGRFKNILLPLGLRLDADCPRVEGESEDGVRPIGSFIAEQTIAALRSFATVDGRAKRRSVILETLGITSGDGTELTEKTIYEKMKTLVVNKISFPLQAIALVMPLAGKRKRVRA